MDKNIKHCIEIYKENRYEWTNKKMLKIDSEEVTLNQRRNHHYLTCTCQSSGSTGNASLCRNKLFFNLYPFINRLFTRIDYKILEYEAGRSLCKTEEGKNVCTQIISDLEEFKRLR